MADIFHNFPITAPASKVYEAIATPAGLDAWWADGTTGSPQLNATYRLSFGPEYQWEGVVSQVQPGRLFELTMTVADADWTGSQVGFMLEEDGDTTHVRFYHTGWPETNEHYRISSFCWAMYLRLLKRYAELNEVVPYNDRLSV